MASPVSARLLQFAKTGASNLRSGLPAVTQRFMCTPGAGGKSNKPKSPPSAPKQPPKSANVGAGSAPIVNTAATETYKVKEYFEHNPYSFYDFNVEMGKMRLPQPSSQK